MARKTFTIMGATGHIGHVLVQELLKLGNRVKALGRDQKKLNVLKSQGAKVIASHDFIEETALTEAFEGSDAIFSFIPSFYSSENFEAYQDHVGKAIKSAIQSSGVRYVLNLSSIGAQQSEGVGPIKGLHRQEQRLNNLPDLNVLHLRPGLFMENQLWSIPVIKQSGVIGFPLRGDLPLLMVATKDIALIAAQFLDRLDFKGHEVFEFGGPRPLTMIEVTKILGKAIGMPNLQYMQFPYQEARREMIEAGMQSNTANLMVEMYQAINEGRCQPTQKISPEHKGKTTMEEFSKIFAEAYKNSI